MTEEKQREYKTKESARRAQNNYYERNKEAIKKARRDRYENDEEFRKNSIKVSSEAVKARRQKEKALKIAEAEKVAWKKFNIKNTGVVLCCSISFLAKNLERSVQTIRGWEYTGQLPKTFFYKRNRWYTKPHFDLIMSAWKKHKGDLSLFFSELHDKWNQVIKENK